MPWQTKPPLAQPKTGLAAVTAEAPAPASGVRIYAIGGGTNDPAVATNEVFDTQANGWTAIAPMPTVRAFFGAAASPGRVHAIGGLGNAGQEVLATHEVYTPATNTWSTAAPMPTARRCLDVATGPDGLVYAVGGSNVDQALTTVEAYDPVSDSWSTRTPMTKGRAGLAVVLGPDGLIYAIGGTTGEVGDSDFGRVETYNPATDAWKAASPVPIALAVLAAAVGPNGLIYAIGGMDMGDGGQSVNNVYSYDPTSPANGWTPRAPMPTARSGLAAATGPDGLVYAMGGFGVDPSTNKGTPFASVEAYAFAKNESVADIDVAGLLKDLVGRTIGGVDRGAGGGIIVGGHYIPIPPRAPVWSKILRAARPYLRSGIDSAELAQVVKKLQNVPTRGGGQHR